MIVICLLTLLALTALIIVRQRNLFAAAMLAGIYSFLGAGWMLLMDAPDVAFTEASVGAGISTVLLLGTLALTTREEKPTRRLRWLPLIAVLVTGAALIYATFDMPRYGDPQARVFQEVDKRLEALSLRVARLNDPSPKFDRTKYHVGIEFQR